MNSNMNLEVPVHIWAQKTVKMKPISVICQPFALSGWFRFLSYNTVRRKIGFCVHQANKSVPEMKDSRGFWKESIAWGQRGETRRKRLTTSWSQASVISAGVFSSESCEGRKERASCWCQWWINKKGKEKAHWDRGNPVAARDRGLQRHLAGAQAPLWFPQVCWSSSNRPISSLSPPSL